jgi:hypothetical protein
MLAGCSHAGSPGWQFRPEHAEIVIFDSERFYGKATPKQPMPKVELSHQIKRQAF